MGSGTPVTELDMNSLKNSFLNSGDIILKNLLDNSIALAFKNTGALGAKSFLINVVNKPNISNWGLVEKNLLKLSKMLKHASRGFHQNSCFSWNNFADFIMCF